MSHPLRAKSAIAGVADAASPSGDLDTRGRILEAAMIREALDDAGLTIADVDGICSAEAGMGAMGLAEHLGVRPTWIDSTMTGGSSYEVHLEHAAAAIALGQAEVIVSVYASTPHSDRKRARERSGGGAGMRGRPGGMYPGMAWEGPFGLRMPIGAYALAASRHMHEFGTTPEQLAQIAVSTRDWATKNPRARFQDPLTIDEVLASEMVCSPLHKLDCCLQTDGAGAFVMVSAERAKDLRKPPVYVLGTGTCTTHSIISQMPILTTTGTAVSGKKAMAMAGVGHADVDLLMLYDSFTITTLLLLEDLGFCEKGEGGAFVEGGALGPGGSLPTNTNGGGLSYTHPGMYGMFLIVEAVKQLRGEAEARQLERCDVAIASGSGGVLSAMSTAVLGSEASL
ncbi:MAG TPA: acetyl-CoA acetyltransferase [Acidimicrobiales bacterium]|nr:acetyl-CoA acetyltransferase [Acidimicrobiales bacterium]